MNKPIFAGVVIPDIAKTVVYDRHYNYILNKFSSEKAKLLFTDTDSLTYSIETDDIYEDILPDSEHIDCSEYPETHVLLSTINKKSLGSGKMKIARQDLFSSSLGSERKCVLSGVFVTNTTK